MHGSRTGHNRFVPNASDQAFWLVGCNAEQADQAWRQIVASPRFTAAPRSKDFLCYVATETIAGRAGRLKETTIGRVAMGRGSKFASHADSAVRVQATRLRALLERYYAAEGADDPVRITLPKGSYVPVFSVAPTPTHQGRPESEWTEGPGLIIGRFVDLNSPDGKSAQSIGAAESLAQAFSQFQGLSVYGPISMTADDLNSGREHPATKLGAHYLLEGSIRVERGWLRVSTRLIDLETSRLVVATTADRDLEQFTGFLAEEELASEIAARLGDARGDLQRDLARPGCSARLPSTYQAMVSFYDYLDRNSPEAAAVAEAALRASLADEPGNPLLLAMLASAQAAVAASYPAGDRPQTLAEARDNATHALAIRPSGLAHTALARVALLQSDFTTCHQEARRAIELEPTNPSVLYLAGHLLVYQGSWTESIDIINLALRLNPRLPTYCHTLRALDNYLKGNWAGALADAAEAPGSSPYLGALVRALALHHLGQPEAAAAHLATAEAAVPDLETTLARSSFYPEQVKQTLLAGIAEINEAHSRRRALTATPPGRP